MKNKIFAGILIGFIFIIIVGILIYFLQSTTLDVIEDAKLNGGTISLLISIHYHEDIHDSEKSRILSLLLLLNPQTNQLGILELPGYTGVYNKKNDQIRPIDYSYTNNGYDAYFQSVKNTLQIPKLQYIFIGKDNFSNFIDLLGGIKIFLLNEEFSVLDNSFSEKDSNIGDIYFDGPGVVKYIQSMENSDSGELLKSTRRKELIIAILSQIQREHEVYANSNKIFTFYNQYIDTSFNKKGLKNILLIIKNYNLEQSYFQRLNGQIRNVSFTHDDATSPENATILFTSNEVGGFANIVNFLENYLMQEYSEKIQDKISITVLNGTVFNGLAKKTSVLYKDAGFKVLFVGNASSNEIETSTIIDRTGNKVNANFAAQIIGVRSIITDITSVDQAGADLTLILGKDFDRGKLNE